MNTYNREREREYYRTTILFCKAIVKLTTQEKTFIIKVDQFENLSFK